MAKKKTKRDKTNKNKNKSGFLKFLGNIFFEEVDKAEEEKTYGQQKAELGKDEEAGMNQIPKDENEKLLQEMYGNIEGKELEEGKEAEEINTDKKKSFFAKRSDKRSDKKKESAELAKEQEDAEELELKKKKEAKAAKIAAAKAKKAEAKAKKAEAKAKKAAAKPKKVKKEKKPKEPPKPEDLLKLRPIPIILMLLFIVGVVVLVNMGNTTFYYYSDINRANESFQNGDYGAAYEAIQGTDPKESDKKLKEQILTVMYVDKQLLSYQNYVKLGKGTEAMDSLVKGIQSYYNYYDKAKDLGISEQLDQVKTEIVEALRTTFAISEEKAIGYVSLSKQDFTQYYMTLESYGGMVQK